MGRVSTWEVHGTWARTHSSVADPRVIKQYMTQLVFCPAMECPEETGITAKARAASEEDGQHQHRLSLYRTPGSEEAGAPDFFQENRRRQFFLQHRHERKAGSE